MKRLKKFNEFFDYNDARKTKLKNDKQKFEPKNLLIDIKQLLKIHDELIENYGGVYGIRDEDQLEFVILKPYMSAFGEDIYPTFFKKISALLQAIVINHPLADGNKRTGFYSTKWILENNGYKLNISYDEFKPVIIDIINNKIDVEEISELLKKNSTKIK